MADRLRTDPLAGPGTERELTIERLAEAMYLAHRFITDRSIIARRWEVLDESVRQRFREEAESWVLRDWDRAHG